MPPARLNLEELAADRLFVQHQIAAAGNRPGNTRLVMWQQRLKAIDAAIAEIDAVWSPLATVAVFFDGIPVIGSREIQLGFSTNALTEFQNIVSTVFATHVSDVVPRRGTLPGASRSRLYIRDIIRGSFGFVLEELPSDQQEFVPTLLSEVVEETTQFVDDLSSPDSDRFDIAIANKPERLIAAVSGFASVLANAHASTRIVGSKSEAALSITDVERLAGRLDQITHTIDQVKIEGEILGIFPDSRRVEFRLASDRGILRGSVNEDFEQKWSADHEFRDKLLLKSSVATFQHSRSTRDGQEVSSQYTLIWAEPKEQEIVNAEFDLG